MIFDDVQKDWVLKELQMAPALLNANRGIALFPGSCTDEVVCR